MHWKTFLRTNPYLGKLGRLSGLFFVPSEADVFLVSFPRSGNSWLRSAIAEMMFGGSGHSLGDIHDYVPSVGLNVPKWRLRPFRFHVVKTHEMRMINSRTDRYRTFIYVVRDPRDVVLSHFRFHSELGKWDGGLDGYLHHWLDGRIWPGTWLQHVTSWLGCAQGPSDARCLVIRYEELFQDTRASYRRVLDFLGLELSDDVLSRVLNETSIVNLRAKEERNSSRPDNFHSIQTGGTGKWKAVLSPEQAAQITRRFGEAMEWFGYV